MQALLRQMPRTSTERWVALMFDKLKRLLDPSQAVFSKVMRSKPNARIHARYHLEDFDFLKLEFPIGQNPKLRDMSFGGFALSKTSLALPEFSEPEIFGHLHIFDKSCPFKARLVYEDKVKVGFQFIHDSEAMLVFLRAFLEDLRCGATLMPLDSVLLNENFQKKYTIALRGDGPVDLYAAWHDGTLTRALFTKRSSQIYEEVRFGPDLLQTGRVLDQDGVTPKMITDTRPNRELIQTTLQILTGAMVHRKDELPMLLALYEQLLQEWNNPQNLAG